MATAPTAVRVSRTIHVHHDSVGGLWTAKLTAVDEGTPKWTPQEWVEKFLTLAEVIAFILDILAGISPTYTADDAANGDLYQLGKTIANTYAPASP